MLPGDAQIAERGDMSRYLRSIEFAWHVVVLLVLMAAFIPLWTGPAGSGIDQKDLRLLIQAMLLGSCLALGRRRSHRKRAASIAARSPWLWGLVAWAFLSSIWSVATRTTLHWSLTILLATLYATLLIERHPFDFVLRVGGTALAIGILGSLISVYLIEDLAVMGGNNAGAWRGVYYHKNALGRFSALSLAAFGALISSSSAWRRWTWAGLFGCALVTLALSRSATSWVTFASMTTAVLGLILLRRLPRRLRPAVAVSGLGVVVFVLAALPHFLNRLLAVLGKDLTLTGRVDLWKILWSIALERPLLGHGFGGFWLGWEGPSARVWLLSVWDAPHAHNGYLGLWLELGVVGLVLGLILIGGLAARSIRGSLAEQDPRPWLFAASIATFIIVCNFAESAFLESSPWRMFYWFWFSYVYLLVTARIRQIQPEDSRVSAL